jgi:hypothetical protein
MRLVDCLIRVRTQIVNDEKADGNEREASDKDDETKVPMTKESLEISADKPER